MAELFDIIVRRQIYVEGLKAAKGNEFAAALGDLDRRIKARLSNVEFDDLGQMTKAAVRRLIVDLKGIAKTVFDTWLKSLIGWLERFAVVDRNILVGSFKDGATDKDKEELDNTPVGEVLFNKAKVTPLAATGTLMFPFLVGLGAAAAIKLERMVTSHYASRAKLVDLQRAITGTRARRYQDGALAAFDRQSRAVTNTVLQHLAANNGDTIASSIFKFYEWVSVLDQHTTVICTDRDGNRYEYGKGPIPPAHVGCRSTTVPVSSLTAGKTTDSFRVWAFGQSTDFINDMFDGNAPTRYTGSRPLTLGQYADKLVIILS